MNDCPDCMTDENAVGEGTYCAAHEIQLLRSQLDTESKRANKFLKALKVVDEWWFDPSEPNRGACSNCEANLHRDFQGRHGQCDGKPCPIQVAHDALVEDATHD